VTEFALRRFAGVTHVANIPHTLHLGRKLPVNDKAANNPLFVDSSESQIQSETEQFDTAPDSGHHFPLLSDSEDDKVVLSDADAEFTFFDKSNDKSNGKSNHKSQARRKPGSVIFDDLGNAQYQWHDQDLLEDGEEGDTRRHRALAFANLVLVDDDPPPDRKIIATNKRGLQQGYNPYDSGRLEKLARRKPRDLRALSKWIEARNRPATPGDADDTDDSK
jgi:hypothetical protein